MGTQQRAERCREQIGPYTISRRFASARGRHRRARRRPAQVFVHKTGEPGGYEALPPHALASQISLIFAWPATRRVACRPTKFARGRTQTRRRGHVRVRMAPSISLPSLLFERRVYAMRVLIHNTQHHWLLGACMHMHATRPPRPPLQGPGTQRESSHGAGSLDGRLARRQGT